VVNHVHQGHEYFLEPEYKHWFRTGCVCGTPGCDWTEHRLDCVFATYMPDVNYTVPEAAARFVDDAIWWLDEFDLDGLRVDAVKHVEDVAITNLSASVRREFEAAGTRYFLMGETAMGWTNPMDCGCNFDAGCSIDCNKSQYDTISQYIGDYKLDGQFDFVLYHAVPYRVFAHDEQGLGHADFWTKASLSTYPAGSVMTPYIGSHDTPRFVTLATYRGQDAAHDKGISGNQWDNVAGPPDTNDPYSRHSIALAWLLGLPGAPLLYYGDEYGQYGGADPGNREDWRSDPAALLPAEAVVLARTQMLGEARRSIEALRRGGYETVLATDNFLAFARPMGEPGKAAIVAISRSASATSTNVTLPVSLGLQAGAALSDWMGGPDVTVGAGGSATISLSAWGSAIYTLK
jgi:glycosidase